MRRLSSAALLSLGVLLPTVAGATSPAVSAPRTLYLVRHGLYDEADPRDEAVGRGLTAPGREQARLVGERLAELGVRFDALWTSPLTRARETARIVAAALPGLAPVVADELAECTPPTWRADLAGTLDPDEAQACRARLERAFARFCTAAPDGERHEILVCHGNVIRWLWCRALGVDPDAWLGMAIANASLTVVQARPDGSCKLYVFGDVGHLPGHLVTYPGGSLPPWRTAPAAPRSGGLLAATLNIWHDQRDWPARRAVILDTLRALAPDVLFLQEVLEKEGLPNQARQLADSLGWSCIFASVDPPGAPKRYGNAILSRHRVAAWQEAKLAPLDDYRVAAHARIDIGGRVLDAYVTHLHHTDEGAAIRARQVADLLAFVDSTRGEGPLVIGGDFNAEPDAPELAPLVGRFVDAYAAACPGPGGAAVTTLNPAVGHAPRRIDHLLSGERSLRPLAAGVFLAAPSPQGVWASDHFGLWARFAWGD